MNQGMGIQIHIYGENHINLYGLERDDCEFVYGVEEHEQGHGGNRERTGNLRRKMAR